MSRVIYMGLVIISIMATLTGILTMTNVIHAQNSSMTMASASASLLRSNREEAIVMRHPVTMNVNQVCDTAKEKGVQCSVTGISQVVFTPDGTVSAPDGRALPGPLTYRLGKGKFASTIRVLPSGIIEVVMA